MDAFLFEGQSKLLCGFNAFQIRKSMKSCKKLTKISRCRVQSRLYLIRLLVINCWAKMGLLMKQLLGAVLLAAMINSSTFAEASDVHQKTTTPQDARYEIIQSELAAKWTFKLDRNSGNVYQLVRTANDGNAWEEMGVQGLPKISNPNKPRFILFTSGLAARHTFLMDTVTGKTWVVTEVELPSEKSETMKINVWKPFEN